MNRGHRKRTHVLDFLLALLISLFWVASYGYTYNISYFNSPPVNWLALLLWTCGLYATLRVHRLLEGCIKGFWSALPLLWVVYFCALLAIEHTGYNILKIRQITSEGPLVLGLIHGPLVMKVYYVFAGTGTVLLCKVLSGRMALFERNRRLLPRNTTGNYYEYDSGKRLKKAL
jgi:hypothetical protein